MKPLFPYITFNTAQRMDEVHFLPCISIRVVLLLLAVGCCWKQEYSHMSLICSTQLSYGFVDSLPDVGI
jgi:hypothetical protein